MIKVGITGQSGFIGSHLYNFLNLEPELFKLVPFQDDFFDQPDTLKDWVSECDVIVHLAALNRHENPEEIYNTNVGLVKILIKALESTDSHALVLFSSSTQEAFENPYGRSKKEGRKLLMDWASRTGGTFTGLVIPNVYGPFGQPFYNSVVATFCYQLANGEQPVIKDDKILKLIYVGELVKVIKDRLQKDLSDVEYQVTHTSEMKVSEILSLVQTYKLSYADTGMIPVLGSRFEINLFNTFRSFMDIKRHFPVQLKQHVDDRGSFVETMRLGVGGQVSFSTTKPGIIRGDHYHTRKIERFAVIRGQAVIRLRRIGTEEVLEYHLDGNQPSYVDMPVWYTHHITNVGEEELYTLFWINEFFDPEDPDTFYETV